MDKLITKNPSENANKLYDYLKSVYGKHILAGQQSGGGKLKEVEVIKATTGKEPAVLGLDFIDYSPSRVERGTSGCDVDTAIEWHKSGGIVTFCWHWNAPTDLIDEAPDHLWHSGFYTHATTFNLKEAMLDKNGERYKLIIRDIDVIAGHLKQLEALNIPVLWRPLHEASGAWFWWGATGAEACIELWKLLFDRLNNYHGLTNLIWVWNGQSKDWYPGDEYCDIIGEDLYPADHDNSSQKERYDLASSCYTSEKMITLSENGAVPDTDLLIKDNVKWSWFCTWCGEFIFDKNNEYNEQRTSKDLFKKIYNSEYCITKDKLPKLFL